jgi:transcriptional regulator with XRE-family HTH domain
MIDGALGDDHRDVDPTEHLGEEISERRQNAGMSIAELARRSDVSAAFISQVESGRSSMSIPTLYRVATALDCTASALLGRSAPHTYVTRAGAGPQLAASTGEHAQSTRLLTRTGEDVLLESYHYVIDPSDDEQEWFHHSGEDFVYVIGGGIIVEFDDGSSVDLAAGDSLHHDGAIGHRWVLATAEPAEVLCVVAPME